MLWRKTLDIAICDNEKEYNLHLARLLDAYFIKYDFKDLNITSYSDGVDLLEDLSKRNFELIFLDVDMPKMSGFDTAEELRLKNDSTDIVFVTNVKDEVRKGYKYNAKDYLYKPVSQEDIDALMDRLLNDKLDTAQLYEVKIKNGGKAYIKISDIVYFESDGHYVKAVMISGEYVFNNKLDEVLQDLEGKGFIRVHQSYVVNMAYVFKDMGNRVILKKANDVPVSRKYKKALSEAFKKVSI